MNSSIPKTWDTIPDTPAPAVQAANLLRIRISLAGEVGQCQWVFFAEGQAPRRGEGPLEELPRGAGCVEVVIPAEQVLILRSQLPATARRRSGALLAYAVEDETLNEPDRQQVCWLGRLAPLPDQSRARRDVLAVIDKGGAARWRAALASAGVSRFEMHAEALLLPWTAGLWSLAWNGSEGIVRLSELEGAATDVGDGAMPPLSLRLLLERAALERESPVEIAVYLRDGGSAPDIAAWSRELGVPVRLAGAWDWRTAGSANSPSLVRAREAWPDFRQLAARLTTAAWMLAAAVLIHGLALAWEWAALAGEQQALRRQMEERFRAVFPESVAVVEPVLQMRRNLVEARHAAGQSDGGDFLPMLEQVAIALDVLPEASIRLMSYESGSLILELAGADAGTAASLGEAMRQAGLRAESRTGAGTNLVLAVRPL